MADISATLPSSTRHHFNGVSLDHVLIAWILYQCTTLAVTSLTLLCAGMLEATQLAQQLPGEEPIAALKDDDKSQHPAAIDLDVQKPQDMAAEPATSPSQPPEAGTYSSPAAMAAAADEPGAVMDALPAEAARKPGKDKHKGSRLAQDVHEDTVKASTAVLAEVTRTLLNDAPATAGKAQSSSGPI